MMVRAAFCTSRCDPVCVQDSVNIYRGKPFGKLGRKTSKFCIPTNHRYELGTELFASVKTRFLGVFKNGHLQESLIDKQGRVFGN